MIQSVALLTTALLFGAMVPYAFGFAAFLFTALPGPVASTTLRRAFPHFYLFVLITATAAAALRWPTDPSGAALLASIALTTLPTRQLLMPAINTATDTGAKTRFKVPHSLSVLITMAHIGATGFVLTRFV